MGEICVHDVFVSFTITHTHTKCGGTKIVGTIISGFCIYLSLLSFWSIRFFFCLPLFGLHFRPSVRFVLPSTSSHLIVCILTCFLVSIHTCVDSVSFVHFISRRKKIISKTFLFKLIPTSQPRQISFRRVRLSVLAVCDWTNWNSDELLTIGSTREKRIPADSRHLIEISTGTERPSLCLFHS